MSAMQPQKLNIYVLQAALILVLTAQALNAQNPGYDSTYVERTLDTCWQQITSGKDSALFYAERAERMARDIQNSYHIAVALEMQAIIYDIRGQRDRAAHNYIQAARLHEERNDLESLLATYNNLGVLFGKLDDPGKELHYYQLAYAKAVELKDSTSQKLGLANLGSFYSKKGNLDSAETFFTEALKLRAERDDSRLQASTYQNLGILYNRREEYRRALEHFRQALPTFDSLQYQEGLVYVLNGMAYSHLSLENFPQALKSARRAAQLAKKAQLANAYLSAQEKLVDAYRGMGKIQKALKQQDEVIQITDSLDRLEREEVLYELEAKYQNEKKQRLIAQLEKEQLKATYQKRLWLIVAIALALSAAFVVWILILRHRRQLREKEQKEALQKERLERQQQQLEQYRGQLREVTNNLIRKNKQLSELRSVDHPPESEEEEKLKDRILTNEDWQQYKKNYELAYPGYFRKLYQKQPDLSEAEQRISALLRLGLSSAEMSSMLGISEDGVRKTVYRLRKKMKLDSNQELKKQLVDL